MSKKNLALFFVFISLSIVLQGCSLTAEKDTPKNSNTNQTVIISNVSSENANIYSSNNVEINNNLTTNSNSGEAINKKTISKSSEPAPKIGSGGDDLALLLQARGKLSTEKELINNVVVEINQGNATLTGKVTNEDQKKKAEQVILSVQGIKSVKNNLRVSP